MQFTMACIPKNQAKLHGKQGFIADYVPTESPMIPPLIVHCINEVQFPFSFLSRQIFSHGQNY